MKKILVLLAVGFSLITLTNCGPKAFVKGSYDQDVNRENLMNDSWSETDMQKAVADLVANLVQHPIGPAAEMRTLLILATFMNFRKQAAYSCNTVSYFKNLIRVSSATKHF